MKMDKFTEAFFECALWSSNDESDEQGGNPLDDTYSILDIAEPCLVALAKECERFQMENASDLESVADGPRSSSEYAGHDFWLTRNGHGAGFWDGNYPKVEGERLTAASKKFGEVNLYVGDDGKIYASGYEQGGG